MSASKAQFKKVDVGIKPLPRYQQYQVCWDQIEWHLKRLLGRALTVIDATISPNVEPDKNKAAKDLVRAAFKTQVQELLPLFTTYPEATRDTCSSPAVSMLAGAAFAEPGAEEIL